MIRVSLSCDLGFAPEDRLLIVNADDFGLTEGTNEAICRLFGGGGITSASLMAPCPSAKHALDLCGQHGLTDVGIHLTLSGSGHRSYRPVYGDGTLPSLIGDDGCFHSELSRIEQEADPEEVRLELEAQLVMALQAGIDPTHLDSHAGTVLGMATGRDFLEVVFDLCEKYRLPFNLPVGILEQPFFSEERKNLFRKRIESARRRGIALIDDLVSLPYCFQPAAEYEGMKARLATLLKNLKPGITQLTVHPSLITDDLIAGTPCYREREIEFRLLNDTEIVKLIDSENIRPISWKLIRDLQRS